MKLPAALTITIEKALNAFIDLDPESKPRLGALQGQVIEIRIAAPELVFYLFVHSDEIEVLSDFDGDIDTTITGSAPAFLAMRDSNAGLFSGEVVISGNMDTGKRFKRYLDALEIDWEEQLSHYIGDTLAYQAGQFYRSFKNLAASTAQSMSLSAGEFLTEESELSPPPSELTRFSEEVDKLRSAVDRLEARLELLESKGDTE